VLENVSMELRVIRKMEEMEGVWRATGISSIKKTENIQNIIRPIPDPEVWEKAVPCSFTVEYKFCIQKEVESCTQKDQIGPLLRREGLLHPISLHDNV
jgi:hypothetical protein